MPTHKVGPIGGTLYMAALYCFGAGLAATTNVSKRMGFVLLGMAVLSAVAAVALTERE
jgi:hypothetical protein